MACDTLARLVPPSEDESCASHVESRPSSVVAVLIGSRSASSTPARAGTRPASPRVSLALAAAAVAGVGASRPWLWALAVGVPMVVVEIAATSDPTMVVILGFAAAGAAVGWAIRRSLVPDLPARRLIVSAVSGWRTPRGGRAPRAGRSARTRAGSGSPGGRTPSPAAAAPLPPPRARSPIGRSRCRARSTAGTRWSPPRGRTQVNRSAQSVKNSSRRSRFAATIARDRARIRSRARNPMRARISDGADEQMVV